MASRNGIADCRRELIARLVENCVRAAPVHSCSVLRFHHARLPVGACCIRCAHSVRTVVRSTTRIVSREELK